MHCNRHDGDFWLLLLALALMMDSDRAAPTPQPPDTASSGGGCAGCLAGLLLFVLLMIGLLAVVHSHPDPPPDAPAAYTQAGVSDSAPRATLISLPVRRALPVDTVTVCRAQLVPKASQR
jgi:hypothetical protein